MRRSPLTPSCARNSWSIRAVGHIRRKRANRRQPDCSGSCAIKRLRECVGVNTANKGTRHSCAKLKICRRPPVKSRGYNVAMKSSGTGLECCSSSALVPTGGSDGVIPEIYLKPRLTSPLLVSAYLPSFEPVTNTFGTPSNRLWPFFRRTGHEPHAKPNETVGVFHRQSKSA